MLHKYMPANQSAYPLCTFLVANVTSTAQATSVGTGALVVSGGMSCFGNLHVGGTIVGGSISYASTSTGTLTVTNTPGTTFNVTSNQQATSVGTGCAVFQGGMSCFGNLHVGGTITGGSIVYSSTSTGTLTITNSPGTTTSIQSTQDSVSKATGALTTLGGIGVDKNISAESTRLFGTTQSTSTGTGTLIVGGGIGLGGNIFIGGSAQSQTLNLTSGTDSTSKATGSLITVGGLGVDKNISAESARLFGTTASTNTTTGSLIVGGGIGLGGNIFAGGTAQAASLNLTSNTESTTTTTGSLTTPGGVGIVRNLRVGGSVFVTGETICLLTRTTGSSAADINNIVQNTLGGANSIAIERILNDTGSGLVLYINSSGRVGDSGPNNANIRNDIGNITFAAQSNTLLLSTSLTSSVPILTSANVASTSPTTGSLIVTGGAGVSGRLSVGDNAIVVGNITGQSINSNSSIQATGQITNGGFDFILGNTDQASRGNSGVSRAIVKQTGNKLFFNFANDFAGGIVLDSNTDVNGNLSAFNFRVITPSDPTSWFEEIEFGFNAIISATTFSINANSIMQVNRAYPTLSFTVNTTGILRIGFDDENDYFNGNAAFGKAHITLNRNNSTNTIGYDIANCFIKKIPGTVNQYITRFTNKSSATTFLDALDDYLWPLGQHRISWEINSF